MADGVAFYLSSIVLGGLLGLIYLKIRKWASYFKVRGFSSIPLVDSLVFSWNIVSMRKNIRFVFHDIYLASQEPIVGLFQFLEPVLMIRDPELANKVLTKDFAYFHDHGFERDSKRNPLDENLFNQTGAEWRTLRNKLSPAFSSGKLKWMFGQLSTCTDELMLVMEKELQPGKDHNIRNLLSRYSVDVIANCAFGFDSGALRNPDNEFTKMSQKFNQPSRLQFLRILIVRFVPKLGKALNIQAFQPDVNNFFIGITKQGLEHRKNTKEERNDFLQLMYELKEKGTVVVDNREDYAEDLVQGEEAKLEFTDELLAAQSFVFLIAGWENGTAVINFALYYIARDKSVQHKIREEIRKKNAKYGSFSYEALKEMTFLDKCISETLRIESLVGNLFRECTKTYTLDDGRVIEKGTKISIPAYSYQVDPKYFYDPMEFIPDRFSQSSMKMTSTFLPFGNGPRVCIGQRFALVHVALGLARILDSYEISVSPRMKHPLVRAKSAFKADAEGGVWLQYKPLY